MSAKNRNQFRRNSLIGEGGFGCVYNCVHVQTGENLAYKCPKDDASEEDVRRFKREVRIQGQLAHPHIMPIIAQRILTDPPFFIMPIAESSLREKIDQEELDADGSISCFLEICSGVAHAHRQGVIHRDLKPENVMYVKGKPTVCDFGLGREMKRTTTTITQSNIALGTIAYMAPEQFVDSANVTPAADVYALGKILFELLTGDFPYPAMDTNKVESAFRYIIEKATRPDLLERFPRVDDLVNEVSLVTQHRGRLLPASIQVEETILQAQDDSTTANIELVFHVLSDREGDESIYQQYVPRISRDLLRLMAAQDNHRFCQMVSVYCGCLSGTLPFSYIDVAADFLLFAYALCEEGNTKSTIVRRIFKIGFENNRWHVRGVAYKLLTTHIEDRDVLIFNEVCSGLNTDYIDWFSERLNDSKVPEILRDIFSKV